MEARQAAGEEDNREGRNPGSPHRNNLVEVELSSSLVATATCDNRMESTPLSPSPSASPGTHLKVLLHRHDSEFSVDSRRYNSTSLGEIDDEEFDGTYSADEEGRSGRSGSSGAEQQQQQQPQQQNLNNDLNIWQGAALLTADCLGTGILALPHDIEVLGTMLGLGFLIINLPINYYAGTILSDTAHVVESKQHQDNVKYQQAKKKLEMQQRSDTGTGGRPPKDSSPSSIKRSSSSPTMAPGSKKAFKSKRTYESVGMVDDDATEDVFEDEPDSSEGRRTGRRGYQNVSVSSIVTTSSSSTGSSSRLHENIHHDTATFDFIGMTSALFHSKFYSRLVLILFYTNIFLVLGDYILVMSHAVAALLGENNICIPTAGLLASTLMFGVAQIRTMAKLGRTVSILSLLALAIVVIQCLYYTIGETITEGEDVVATENESRGTRRILLLDDTDMNGTTTGMMTEIGNATSVSTVSTVMPDIVRTGISTPSILTRLAALGSIGFATGSQKLFLNIRHEFKNRNDAPKSLGISLTAFGTLYVLVCILAGNNPPGFLFDAIPHNTYSRQIAGFLLWVHVVVSYAINSQAICASMDRLILTKLSAFDGWNDATRWMFASGIMAILAFVVANAIPFFKDLVALIGALTSVPLTLLFPALMYRRGILKTSLWTWSSNSGISDMVSRPSLKNSMSYGLMIFSVIFMVAALLGSLDEIGLDWEHHTGGFFACQG